MPITVHAESGKSQALKGATLIVVGLFAQLAGGKSAVKSGKCQQKISTPVASVDDSEVKVCESDMINANNYSTYAYVGILLGDALILIGVPYIWEGIRRMIRDDEKELREESLNSAQRKFVEQPKKTHTKVGGTRTR